MEEKLLSLDEVLEYPDFFKIEPEFEQFRSQISAFIKFEITQFSKEIKNQIKKFFNNSKEMREALTGSQSLDLSSYEKNGFDKIKQFLVEYVATVND